MSCFIETIGWLGKGSDPSPPTFFLSFPKADPAAQTLYFSTLGVEVGSGTGNDVLTGARGAPKLTRWVVAAGFPERDSILLAHLSDLLSFHEQLELHSLPLVSTCGSRIKFLVPNRTHRP